MSKYLTFCSVTKKQLKLIKIRLLSTSATEFERTKDGKSYSF